MPRIKPLRTFEAVHDHAVKTNFPMTRTAIQEAKKIHFERKKVNPGRGSAFRNFNRRIHVGLFPKGYSYLGQMTATFFEKRLVTGTVQWRSVIGKYQNSLIRRKVVRTRKEASRKMKRDAELVIREIKAKLSDLEERSGKGLLSEGEKVVRNGYRSVADTVVLRLKRLVEELDFQGSK